MIRHVAFFRFKDSVTTEDIDKLDEGLRSLPPRIDEIRGYECGRDLGLMEGTWDYAVVADFDDVEGYRAYAEHPAHVEVSTTRAKPLMAESMRVQFSLNR